jgi:hypothetical protein
MIVSEQWNAHGELSRIILTWWRSIIYAMLVLVATTVTSEAVAEESDSLKMPPVIIHPGSIEIGIGGSLVAVEGIVSASLTVRGGSFFSTSAGNGSLELALTYTHLAIHDLLDIQPQLTWSIPIPAGSVIPFLCIGGGVRQEWIGSFTQLRYPVGAGGGIRAMMGREVGVRAEYLWRYLLNDPIAGYSEHSIQLGLSWFLCNQPD